MGTLSPHSIRLVAPTALTLKAAGSSHGAHSKAAEVQSAGHQLAPLCDEDSPIRARTRARVGPKNPRGSLLLFMCNVAQIVFMFGTWYRLGEEPEPLLKSFVTSATLDYVKTRPRVAMAQIATDFVLLAIFLSHLVGQLGPKNGAKTHANAARVRFARRGETDWHDRTGMSQPHDRIWRGAPAPDPGSVCRVL